MSAAAPAWLLGLDFSSAPSARKPLTLAWGRRAGSVVRLERVDELPTHAALSALLDPAVPGPLAGGFVMGCDFPFGLPRVFVEALARHGPGQLPRWLGGHDPVPGVPPGQAHALSEAERLIRALHAHCEDRTGFQRLVDGWGDTWHADRPPGPRLAHRTADLAIPDMVSTSPLQTRYVPVGKMYFEGLIAWWRPTSRCPASGRAARMPWRWRPTRAGWHARCWAGAATRATPSPPTTA